ncbi:ATP-dependent DNA helicase RecG, partial [Streptomyces sp. DT225]
AKDKPHFLSRAWERVREEVENGHQAYVVCPRIGDDEDDPAKKKGKKAAEEDGDKRPPLAVLEIAEQLSQGPLNGLRGRVGRGSAPGLCLLVTEAHEASPARARLSAVAATLDGFELSRIDLEQRREGDVLGQAQSGVRSSLRVLNVIDDEEVIAAARQEAVAVVAADPGLEHLPELRT